jgi:DNA-binding XRE family transcriptional regulator
MKQKRMKMGWNQFKAAREVGVGIQTWRDIEQGAVKPNSLYLPIIERWLLMG